MDFVLDLSVLNTKRYFVVGDIRGDYESLVNLLYNQGFNKDDTLVTTGNNIDLDNDKSLDCLYFLANCHNTYSVKGKREFDACTEDNIPNWLEKDSNYLINYLEELPLIIKINDFIYVVNAGVEPGKKLEEQALDVFYNIGKYDSDSRFYQFENPEKKSWYEYEFLSEGKLIKYCFGGFGSGKIQQSAGYDLGRDINSSALKLIIINKGDHDSPILIEQ